MIWKARIWRLSWILWSEKKDIVGWSGRSKFSSKKWGKINEIHRKSIKIGAKNGNRVYLNSSRLIAQWFGNITWQTVARETMKFYKKTWSNPISAEGVLRKWLRSLSFLERVLFEKQGPRRRKRREVLLIPQWSAIGEAKFRLFRKFETIILSEFVL